MHTFVIFPVREIKNLNAVVLVSCYTVFSRAVGTMTGGSTMLCKQSTWSINLIMD